MLYGKGLSRRKNWISWSDWWWMCVRGVFWKSSHLHWNSNFI